MKKKYEKPSASLVELSFDEHIAGSGGEFSNECVYQFIGRIKNAGCVFNWIPYAD